LDGDITPGVGTGAASGEPLHRLAGERRGHRRGDAGEEAGRRAAEPERLGREHRPADQLGLLDAARLAAAASWP